MVNGHVEEALLLVGMEVHGHESVDTCYAEKVGYEFGTDGNAGLALAVLTRPTEIGHYGTDTAGRSTLGCVNHQKELHQIVGVGEGGLYQEEVAAADALFVTYFKLAICKFGHHHVAKRTF